MEMTVEFMWYNTKASVAGQVLSTHISKHGITTINSKYGNDNKIHEVNYQVIIKSHSICMFRYMVHTIYLRIQVERGWLLEIDGDRQTIFRVGPGMVPGLTICP